MTLETPARTEPCGIEESVPVSLTDFILEIRSAPEALGRLLHPESAAELRGLSHASEIALPLPNRFAVSS